MLIVYSHPGTGWEPVTYMVNLAVELFDAELLTMDFRSPSCLSKLETLLLKRQKRKGYESCLLVCPTPTNLLSLLHIQGWRKRFRYVAAWIIDCFWIERISKLFQLSQPFDHLFVTLQEDIPAWTQVMKTPTTWLPWGTDALRLGGSKLERNWDLVRVGRQPPEWEDDFISEQTCLRHHLRFQGRPMFLDDPQQNQAMLMRVYQQTKFLLAFSNAVNPMVYTHPSREYLTARWVDALACGAVVAGVQPKGSSVDRLLWPGATLDLGSICREDGLKVLADAARHWKTEQADRNYKQALVKLDWRWRFKVIAEVFKESPMALNHELKLLERSI